MKNVNEQLSELQQKALESLEPMQSMNSLAAQAFERIARKNYDLMGDLVDYAVAQVKVPESNTNMQELYEQRVADTQAFAEKVNERAAEYVELAGELGEMVQTQVNPDAAATGKTAAKKKKASPAKKKAVSRKKKAVASKKKTASRKATARTK